jgi:hypothetical protein
VSICWEWKGCGSPPPFNEYNAPPVRGEVGDVGELGGVQIKVVPRPPAPVPAAGGPTDKDERRGPGQAGGNGHHSGGREVPKNKGIGAGLWARVLAAIRR